MSAKILQPIVYPMRESPSQLVNPAIFKYKGFSGDANVLVFELQADQLSQNECHMFFTEYSKEMLTSTEFELVTFKNMNDKFKKKTVKVGNFDLVWVSFPMEFKDVCVRVAKTFGLTILRGGKESTALPTPKEHPKLNAAKAAGLPSRTPVVEKDAVAKIEEIEMDPGTKVYFPCNDHLLMFIGPRNSSFSDNFNKLNEIKKKAASLDIEVL